MPEATTQPASSTPGGLLRSLSDFLRWFGFIVLVTAAAGGLALYCIQSRLDDEIRRRVEGQFRSHYRHLQVTVGSARRIEGVGIEIRGIRIAMPSRSDQPRDVDGTMVYVDEMLVICSTELSDLVAGRAQSQRIVIRRPQLTARCEEDGCWNLATLLPLPKLGSGCPDVCVENASVEIRPRESSASIRLDGINVTLVPQSREPSGDVPNSLSRFQGQARGNWFSSASVEGQIDLANGGWSAQGTMQGLETSPDSMASLPSSMTTRFQMLSSYRGLTQLNFRAQGVGCDAGQCRFVCSGSSQGRIEDSRLPQPVTDVQIAFSLDNKSLQIERATARSGETTMEASGTVSFPCPASPLRMRASAVHLMLDEHVANFLPPAWRDIWQQLSPRGFVNGQAELVFDGTRWSPEITVDCLDVAATYAKFPYPLSKIQGRVRLTGEGAEFQELRASANGRLVTLHGKFSPPGRGGAGWLEFLVKDPLPLDEQLLASLQGPAQTIVRALEPHGFASFWGRYERVPGEQSLRKRLEIGLSDCSINYERFRYPLYRIRGTLSMTNDCWSFSNLEGCNDSGWVTCNGRWEPAAEGGTVMALNFQAMDVPLEDELRNALKPEMQQVWNSLCPRGTVDQLKIGVHFQSRTGELAVDVTALKRPPHQNVEGRSISIKPTWLPYQWDDVVGTVHFNSGLVELQSIRARHGDTRLDFSGRIETSEAGPWRVHLSPLNLDRVDATRELVTALPQRLGHALSRLNVTGLVSMSGSVNVAGDHRRAIPPTAAWKLNVDLEDGGMDCGARFEHLRGGLISEGEFNGTTLVSNGELNLDSMMCKGVQLTRVSGPVHMEDAVLRFGERIPESRRRGTPRPVTAGAWGGTMSGSGEVQLGEPALFDFEMGLTEGDLAAISQEATEHKRRVTGRAFANLRLNGSSDGIHTLRGLGRVLLREADIYELPVMVSMLKLLTIKAPDRTAFTSSDVDFRIEADRIYFDRIDFDGDAISLDGRGEMSLDRQIHLTFGTTVGRDDYYATLLRPILKEAGRRLMVIEVVGTLDDPQLRRELVPQLSERFQQMFPGAARESPQTSRLPDPLLSR